MTMMTELTPRNNVSPQSTAWRNGSLGEGLEAEQEIGKGNFLAQYKALVLRNFTLKLRERRKTITEFVMPLYFIMILALIRLAVKDVTFEQILTPHGKAPLKASLILLTSQTLHIAPNTSQVEDLMENVRLYSIKNNGPAFDLKYYETEQDILKLAVVNESAVDYAVIFNEVPLENMSYTLRLNPLWRHLPSATLRYSGGETCRHPDPTGGLLSFNCPANNYFTMGFAGLQSLIDMTMVEMTTNENVSFPEVTLQMYPKGNFTSDSTYMLRSIVPLYMVFAWAQFIVYMMILVVEEKEKKIKEGMKMMGLRDSVYWLSWFTIYGGYVIILALICVIVLPLAKVFVHVNLFLLFLLFILYGFSSIVFALMLTPFFNKAKVAGIVGNLTQILFSLLYYLQVYLGDKIGTGTFWALGIFSPCAFSLALDKVLYFDFYGGLNFSNMWDGDGLPFAGSLIMISIDIFLYLFLAFYLDNVVPSEYGTKRKPWFLFQKSFWIQQNKEIQFSRVVPGNNGGYEDDIISESFDIEPVSADLKDKVAVRIRHLTKTFHPKKKDPVTAVNDFSLDIYEGQITAILGHNGAGKTTLFNILTGMLAPTSGTASVFGLDISDANELTDIRRITGVCPQHDIIFMTLTPREHLSFFARVRGIPPRNVTQVVDQTLKEVDLFSKADTKAADLSGGQKRKLSIGIALIGDPKIIFLDEPTAGVDAYSRRRLWGLLRNRKQGKVILLTTHFMDEADILADRKAIMSKGRLRCCGSSLFLKNKFGLGYHLTLVVDDSIVPEAVTEELQKVVKETQLARHFGKEMSFLLPSDSALVFPDLFSLLDRHVRKEVKSVGIEAYGVSMTTLEEVFLSLSEENEMETTELRSIDNLGQQMIREKSSSSSPIHQASPEIATNNGVLTTGDNQGFAIDSVEVSPNTSRTFKALLKVRIINTLREPAAVIFLVIFPLVFTVLSIYLSTLQEISIPTDQLISLSTDIYGSDIADALIHNSIGPEISPVESTFSDFNVTTKTYDGLYNAIFPLSPSLTAWNVNEFPSSELNGTADVLMNYNETYVHSIPILLNVLSNSLLKAAGISDTIKIFSQQLPSSENLGSFDFATYFSPVMIGFTFTMMPAGLGMEMVQDRELMIQNMLRLNGVSFNMYFGSIFSVMMVMYLVNYIGLLIIIVAFNLKSLIIPAAFACIAILYFIYMPCALLYSAVFGYIFDKAETARQFYPSMATTIGFVGYTAVSIVDMAVGEFSDTDNPALYIHIALTVLIPHYIPFGILYYINRIYLKCSVLPNCSDPVFNDYMTTEIILMFVMTLVDIPLYYILLRVADTLKSGGNVKDAFFVKTSGRRGNDKEHGIDAPAGEDDDVHEERANVLSALSKEDEISPVLVYDVGKIYSKGKKKNPCKQAKDDEREFVALKSVSLEVKSGQVFGLLGPNGAGKTTSLRIMTAQEAPSKGQVKICGTDVVSSMSGVFEDIGYCPQHDSLWKNITVAEHIACIAAVRGVKENQIKQITEMFLNGLEIMEHKNKKSKNCSGGTKRKLSYILSMIGKPKIVLLDEPSTGMDPQSKRFLWNSILASFRGQRSAILTTHSMEEADALCSRIAILVRGGLRCIGAIQHLKNKYGGGYSLELKLNPKALQVNDLTVSPDSQQSNSEYVNNQMEKLVKEIFPNSYIYEHFDERIIFKIPQHDVTSLADCFSMLEKAKRENVLQEYALSQTTLEQVFLKFARQQEEEDQSDEVPHTHL